MGCCISSAEDIQNEETRRLISHAPHETPQQTVNYLLNTLNAESWVAKANAMQDQGVNTIDIVLKIVAANSLELNQNVRKALLEYIYMQLNNNEVIHRFNIIADYGNGFIFTRLERIRILLKEDNEELCQGQNILNKLKYKSVMFEKIMASWPIRYTMVVDRSGSMEAHDHHGHSRWHDAKKAAEHMSERIERFRLPAGMTLYLFSSRGDYPRYDRLRTCQDIHHIFHHQHPHGGTDLAGAINRVFADHFIHNEREHVLIVTDGEPDDHAAVVGTLVNGINRLRDENELGFTFMQVGCDHRAADWLHELQDCITEKGARFNVIDCITHHQYHGMSLSSVIDKFLPM